MIVVDATIILPFYIETSDSESIQRLRLRDPHWIAPGLWRSEVRNALALFIRKERISLDEAVEIQLTAENLMQGFEHPVYSEEVLRLAQSSGCSAYDCEYVALALSASTRLYTFDKRVLRAFPEVAYRPE